MQRQSRLVALGCWFLAVTVIAASSPDASEGVERPPNFIIIFADDLGYNDLGCFGSPLIRTPVIDRLAAGGMKFTDFYAQPICGPSRAALMTGSYPMRTAEINNYKHLHPIPHRHEIFLPQLLQEAGYATACIGKWGLAGHESILPNPELNPVERGFDQWFGTSASNGGKPPLYRNGEATGELADMDTLMARYTTEAVEFIHAQQSRPFFLYLSHNIPHTRLGASPAFKGKSPRGLYGDAVEEMDWSTGQVIASLEELDLVDNTWVIFVSDNGPWLAKKQDGGSAEPLRSGKVSTWEGGVRVPFVVWAPGRVPAGRVCSEVATTMDLLPTLMSLIGEQLPQDLVIDGRDITDYFRGTKYPRVAEKPFYYYIWTHLQAVRLGDWKLVLPRSSRPAWLGDLSKANHFDPVDMPEITSPQLFNLRTDIGERDDVAVENTPIVRELLLVAETARRELGDYNVIGTQQRQYERSAGPLVMPGTPETGIVWSTKIGERVSP